MVNKFSTLLGCRHECFIITKQLLTSISVDILYSYFMLQLAIVQNIFPEVQVPTWQAIVRGEDVLHYCLFKLEITVLLSNYIYIVM